MFFKIKSKKEIAHINYYTREFKAFDKITHLVRIKLFFFLRKDYLLSLIAL